MNTELYIYYLKSGREILIDLEDRPILEKYILNTMKPKHSYTRYVVCKNATTRKYAGLLHRILLHAPDDIIIDHINGNGLHCNKDNLRISDYSRNQQNRRLTKLENETKGLYYRKDRGYWVAKITLNKKQIVLGAFTNQEDAIIARLNAEKEYYPDRGDGTLQYPEVRGSEY